MHNIAPKILLSLPSGLVHSLTGYSGIPKGDSDIRMVHSRSVSGLNDALLVPTFCLPTLDSLLRMVDATIYMTDLDIAKMFLNFILDPNIRAYCGVDPTAFFSHDGQKSRVLWEPWETCIMGAKQLPYQAVKALH
eukprot:1681160-Ditylum_brightwellii.AAC.1